jgi:hypothetical protein
MFCGLLYHAGSIVEDLAEMRTRSLPDTSLGRYRNMKPICGSLCCATYIVDHFLSVRLSHKITL